MLTRLTRCALLALPAVLLSSWVMAQSADYECPKEFDQTYEWDDRGYLANSMRETLLADGIANDPGPNALQKGKQRIIVSGDDQVVIQESEGWIIELDQEAMIAGRRPYSRARRVWQRSYEAAIGDRRYRAVEASEKPRVQETRPRRPGQSLPINTLGSPGPVELNPTLADVGTPGFERGRVRTVAGYRCVEQTFAPTGAAPGPRSDDCLLALPKGCANARLLRAMTHESSVFDGKSRKVVRVGRTIALKMGARGEAVDPRLMTPPPASLEPPTGVPTPPRPSTPRPPEPPALICDCRAPQSYCTPEQRRDCERRTPKRDN